MRYSLARLFADTDINQHGSGPLTQLGIHGKQRTLITISNKPIVSATLQGVVTHLAKEWTTHWRNQCPLDQSLPRATQCGCSSLDNSDWPNAVNAKADWLALTSAVQGLRRVNVSKHTIRKPVYPCRDQLLPLHYP